jgi:hypothetical protein
MHRRIACAVFICMLHVLCQQHAMLVFLTQSEALCIPCFYLRTGCL